MIRDVFYLGAKPNVHPRERPATSLDDARNQATTEHFWIVNEFCLYQDFDWEFDFELLPDEDVWAEHHNNVWPSVHQKDSGTWLCSKEHSDITLYRADVPPLRRKIDLKNWVMHGKVEFDFSWHPDPTDPPYIYTWGNKWIPGEVQPTLEYHVPGATDRKYMDDPVTVLPEMDRWKILIPVDQSFDFSWRPDPIEPPFIYTWGNQWNSAVKEPTLEYHVPGATDRKYMDDPVIVLPEMDHWETLIPCAFFDFSWRPDPDVTPYIYVFGNKWNDAKTEPSVRYTVPGAVDTIYLDAPVVIPAIDHSHWETVNPSSQFDYSWRPNPHAPAQNYEWLNGPKYRMPGTTNTVYMDDLEELDLTISKSVGKYTIKSTLYDLIKQHPGEVFWAINPDLKYEKFDFSWIPTNGKERYISVFGQKYAEQDEGVMVVQTYFVNGPAYALGFKEFNYVSEEQRQTDLSMFWIDKGNPESATRYGEMLRRYPKLQKTRYLNSWVDTISRCVVKSATKLFWVLNSELDYSDFVFDFYPDPWQMKMVHIFGTQWSHWGTTYLINRETFVDDTKWVKIIEHLSNLNLVKGIKARATNRLYDLVMIDHGNGHPMEVSMTVQYEVSYLRTFRKILDQLPERKEQYVWICSSVCDYSKFDFSYICDPFAKEQLHVFPSEGQKFGDTFLVNVTRLRELVDSMETLEEYPKINFTHLKVNRLPAPVIQVSDDTHHAALVDTTFPYAVYQTEEILAKDEPMNLWSAETKAIQITSTGGTRIVVPREAKAYVTKELYDYQYITKNSHLAKSAPMDIVFLSNGEIGADENFDHLARVTKGHPNRVVRVDGVTGRVAAYHACAAASNTPWYLNVFAKLKVNPRFDWSFQPDRLQVPKHYIFYATNSVNGLEYGNMAAIAYNKKLVLLNEGRGLDFTLDDEHTVVPVNSGQANFNTDPFSTWRTAFREVLKLRASDDQESKARLATWLSTGIGQHAQYCLDGARHAMDYYTEVDGDLQALRLSYDWQWLHDHFSKIYQIP